MFRDIKAAGVWVANPILERKIIVGRTNIFDGNRVDREICGIPADDSGIRIDIELDVSTEGLLKEGVDHDGPRVLRRRLATRGKQGGAAESKKKRNASDHDT